MAKQLKSMDGLIELNHEAMRILFKALKERQNLVFMQPDTNITTIIRNNTTYKKTSSSTLPTKFYDVNLIRSLTELRYGKLGSVLATSKNNELVSITYENEEGFILSIEDKTVFTEFNLRKIMILFQALTLGACQE